MTLFTTASCKKEIYQTENQVTVTELQRVIRLNDVQRVLTFELDTAYLMTSSLGQTYSFSNGFVSASGFSQSFNLKYLLYYEVTDHDFTGPATYRCLVLWFPAT
jgi:hypothetical protein